MDIKKGWFEPYILNPHNIEKFVREGWGVFVLGNLDNRRKFQIKELHSSLDVKSALYKALGKYHVFMYKPMREQKVLAADFAGA